MDRLQHLVICGAISQLPAAHRAEIADLAERIRDVVDPAGELGHIALALVLSEKSLKD